ncbi:MAG: hypothetical protein LBR38_03030, partial [Synergistaceae bacterium]|nr:hypothetical protein [Synergistaceae bacterium]
MARQNPKRPARRRAKWHQAFVDALHTGLRRYRDVLELLPEFPLTSEPMRLDLLIIKKQPGAVINKSICRG